MDLVKGSITVESEDNSNENLHVSVGYNNYGTAFIEMYRTLKKSNRGYDERSIHEADIEPLYNLLGAMFDCNVSFEDLIEYCENLTDYRG